MDPLITELIGGVRSGDRDIAPSIAQALAAVCSSAGQNIGAPARTAVIDLVEEAFSGVRAGKLNCCEFRIFVLSTLTTYRELQYGNLKNSLRPSQE